MLARSRRADARELEHEGARPLLDGGPAGCYLPAWMPPLTRAVAAGRQPLVLVVDDVADTRDMYAEYLDYVGVRAETAENGRQAVRRALRTRPDAIVMDLAMPVLDGWEATRILHADPRTKDIPIVVITGNAQPDQKRRAEECGAMLVLTKPCLPSDLYEVLRPLLPQAKAAK